MFEVAIGVVSAIIVANLLQDWHADPPPTAPGWRHLLGAQWPAVLHGARSAIAVVVVLWIWILIDLPQVTQMAITDRGGDGGAGHRRRRPQHAGRPSPSDRCTASSAACWAASWRWAAWRWT